MYHDSDSVPLNLAAIQSRKADSETPEPASVRVRATKFTMLLGSNDLKDSRICRPDQLELAVNSSHVPICFAKGLRSFGHRARPAHVISSLCATACVIGSRYEPATVISEPGKSPIVKSATMTSWLLYYTAVRLYTSLNFQAWPQGHRAAAPSVTSTPGSHLAPMPAHLLCSMLTARFCDRRLMRLYAWVFR